MGVERSTTQLRVGLTISGAVALGAFEGGALAALLVAVQDARARGEDVRIDAIAGASAGSMTGLLTARALLVGQDPVDVMWEAWVVQPSLKRLRGRGRNDPLSVEALAEGAAALLGRAGDPQRAQNEPVRLEAALGALRGLTFDIGRRGRPPVRATTYLDWGTFTFTTADPLERWLGEPVQVALASGAHAAAFPPRVLDRRAYRDEYEANGIVGFPAGGRLWYTDGGTIYNEPLGRCLDLTQELDGDLPADATRLHLLVVPDPHLPLAATDPAWADPDAPPEWTRTLARAAAMVAAQSIYDDLRRAERRNSRLAWTAQLEAELEALLSGRPEAESALRSFVEGVRGERAALAGGLPKPAPEGLAPLLAAALHEATGLSGKRQVAIEAVSPLLLDPGDPGKQLSGEFLGHFGGFLDERLRRGDFALGYRATLAWLREQPFGLSPAAAAARYDSAWETGLAHAGLRDLPLRARRALYRLGLRIARIAWRELR